MTLRSRLATRPWLLGALAFSALLATWSWLAPDVLYGRNRPLPSYPAAAPLSPRDRITVVAPHLDDETLGAGGLIAEARRKGIPVSVIFMSNGDDFPLGANLEFKTGYPSPAQMQEFGIKRQEEAKRACARLGVSEDSLYFLSFPDRGLAKLLSPSHETVPYAALGTRLTHAGYPEAYDPSLPYTGAAVRLSLSELIKKTAPTRVYTTSPLDKHSDHAATAAFVRSAVATLPEAPRLEYFVIHAAGYPAPKGLSHDLPLFPSSKLAKQESGWETFPLASQDVRAKQDAVNEYVTQLRVPQISSLMRSLIRQNELFHR